jgi:GDPmannose 4,6-dehydratase
MKRALITGITGQDGSYLAELLINKGYVVHGIIRRSSVFNTQRIDHIYQDPHSEKRKLHLHYGDLVDASNLSRLIERIEPDEIYNLAAQSHVAVSFEQPEYTSNVNALGTLRLLDAIREARIDTRFYQASTSEMYGNTEEVPQDEETPFNPQSPYACSKVFAHNIARTYRESYGMFICSGILFNHESPRRGKRFVTRKITCAVAKIKAGIQKTLFLGNLNAKRDWGYAPEYVEAMWQMLKLDQPGDLVIGTGETHSVREFAQLAFQHAGYDLSWKGAGIEERGIDKKSGETLVEIDPRYFRPTDVNLLIGDSSRARRKLGWENRMGFEDIVRTMVESDMSRLQKDGEIGLNYLE